MLDVKTMRNLSWHKSSCRDTRNKEKAESMSRHKIFCHDIYYCNLENPVETLYEEVFSRLGNECHDTKI